MVCVSYARVRAPTNESSARRQAEADAQVAVAALDGEAQPLALAAPAMVPLGDPAEGGQAGEVESLHRCARHLAARLDLDDAALRLVEDDESALLVAQTGHQRHILSAGDEAVARLRRDRRGRQYGADEEESGGETAHGVAAYSALPLR